LQFRAAGILPRAISRHHLPKECTMAEVIRDDRYVKPVEPVDPVDPTNCPTCLSGFQPVDPPYERAIDPVKEAAY
jgi:hypothetical protein